MSFINTKYLATKIAILLLLSSCSLNAPVKKLSLEELELWNKIVTKNIFQSRVGPGEFSTTYGDQKVVYLFVYKTTASNPNYVLSATIEVRVGGALIDQHEYEHTVASTPLGERAWRFPSIGSRAQTTASFFGPGGSSFGLLSTTNDELYDISVNVLTSGSQESIATFDAFEISSSLHQSYDFITIETKK